MKQLFGLFAIMLAVNFAVSLPARSPEDDAEVIGGPRYVKTSRGSDDSDRFDGVVTSDVGYPFLESNPHTFSLNWGYFDAFEDLLRRLHARVRGIGQTEESSDESDSKTPLGLDDKNNEDNSYTVKVIDGHKVEVNQTVIGGPNSLFKIRVVQVRPLEDDEKPVEGTITSGGTVNLKPSTSRPTEFDEDDEDDDRETVGKKSSDNEILEVKQIK